MCKKTGILSIFCVLALVCTTSAQIVYVDATDGIGYKRED